MKSKVQIFLISTDNCKYCDRALEIIQSAIKKCSKITCELLKYEYNNRVAIHIAINKNINTLPGIVIGNKIFQKNNFTEEDIIDAIEKAAKN